MKWTVAILALACCTAFANAKPRAVTKNPNERGVTLIGPDPNYECEGNGAFPHEINCELFYDCYNDLANLMGCTDNTLFDLTYNGCEDSAIVDCGDRIRPNGTTGPPPTTTTTTRVPPTVTPGPGEPECSPDNHGSFHPDTIYCERYYECDNYDAILHYCEEDLLFDLTFYGCNFPDKVDCGDRIRPNGTTGPPPTRPTAPPQEFDCPSNGAFPHEIYCEKYWDCYNDVATLLACPGDWLFGITWGGCEKPEDVDCGDRIRPNETTTTTTVRTTTTTTTLRPPTTGEPPVESTEEPIRTTPGEPVTEEPIRTTPGAPVTDDPEEFRCPQPSGNFPDPKDCGAFYQCSNGVAHHVKCDVILRYSIPLEVCAFPENVDCGTRPIPPL